MKFKLSLQRIICISSRNKKTGMVEITNLAGFRSQDNKLDINVYVYSSIAVSDDDAYFIYGDSFTELYPQNIREHLRNSKKSIFKIIKNTRLKRYAARSTFEI